MMCLVNVKYNKTAILFYLWLKGDKTEKIQGTVVSGPEVSEINLVLLAIYMVLMQTILINFLIAMFS